MKRSASFRVIAVLLAASLSIACASLRPDGPARPKHRVQPVLPEPHPPFAGRVVLAFDIDPEGKVRNLEVVESTPEGVFDKPATDAVSQWRYYPKVENGEPIWTHGLRMTMDFTPDEHD